MKVQSKMSVLVTLAFLAQLLPTHGFKTIVSRSSQSIRFALRSPDEPSTLREFSLNPLRRVLQTASVLSTSALILAGSPNSARAGSLEDANEKLSNYGLPPIIFVPPVCKKLILTLLSLELSMRKTNDVASHR